MKYRTKDRIAAWLLLTAIAFIVIVGGAWSLMVAAGIAHRDWWRQVPVMGFGTAVALTFWPWFFTVLAVLAIGALRGLTD